MSKTYTPRAAHIMRVFREAVVQGVQADDWYATAHDIAADMGARHGVTVEQAAGVIAAVSPLNSWGSNVNLAERLLATRVMAGYMGAGLRKVERILAGESVESVLTSDKVSNFYRSIATRGAEGVCIDRHAWCICINKRLTDVSITRRQYARATEVYVDATRRINREHGLTLAPAQVQSMVWVAWRNRYWNEGAFDPKS